MVSVAYGMIHAPGNDPELCSNELHDDGTARQRRVSRDLWITDMHKSEEQILKSVISYAVPP